MERFVMERMYSPTVISDFATAIGDTNVLHNDVAMQEAGMRAFVAGMHLHGDAVMEALKYCAANETLTLNLKRVASKFSLPVLAGSSLEGLVGAKRNPAVEVVRFSLGEPTRFAGAVEVGVCAPQSNSEKYFVLEPTSSYDGYGVVRELFKKEYGQMPEQMFERGVAFSYLQGRVSDVLLRLVDPCSKIAAASLPDAAVDGVVNLRKALVLEGSILERIVPAYQSLETELHVPVDELPSAVGENVEYRLIRFAHEGRGLYRGSIELVCGDDLLASVRITAKATSMKVVARILNASK